MSEVPSVRVFDSAMCCSTGVCGPDVDPKLIRFAADLDWIREQGLSVERYNLAQQPGAFAAEPLARQVLQEKGEEGLPLILIDGVERSSGDYPSRETLADWVGLDATPEDTLWTDQVLELVAISASVACNCVSCLSAHEQGARSLGVSTADIHRAVEVGRAVREAAAERVLTHAERLSKKKSTALRVSDASACCSPAGTSTGGSDSSGCC